MPRPLSRRDALKQIAAAGAGVALGGGLLRGQTSGIIVGGTPVDIAVLSLSATTIRITLAPIANGSPASVPYTGALAQETFGTPAHARSPRAAASVRAGNLIVKLTENPPTIHIETATGTVVQQLTLNESTAGMGFLLPKGPLLGLGEGGPQFDRKGKTDQMRNGQVTSRADGYSLAVNGTRAPIQWLIGTDGWAMFIHQPYGSFDFKGPDTGTFTPAMSPNAPIAPLDVFIVHSADPAVVMREYARISGLPELPARWTFGYLQSHRTLAGNDEVMNVAKTMRDKKLPCEGLIYLGTDFCPSGWNTHNGEFTWHPVNFPDPKTSIDALHAEHFKVILHIVIEGRTLTGTVHDPCTAAPLPPGRIPQEGVPIERWQYPPDRQVSCYWPAHKPLMDLGVDGWWPDQGDGFDGPSRLNRHRMYWEGTQMYRPNERPFALHRNASAGVQRYGGFIWSGDVQSQWSTLKAHVPDAINTGLSGLPYWGTDIGGFYGTKDFTGELFVRWFQFGAFCPLFRSHGRNWHLHTPWGWDGGDGGPPETAGFTADPTELQNKDVEPICRKYLELRSQLMPYLYTAAKDACETGMPILRAMWLHYPDDPDAVALGDQYLWGRDLLVAPVVEKGAASRSVYLPRGAWIDFWTEKLTEGARRFDRAVDLATVPLYVRAGAILPMGPIRQYADEPSDEPLTLVVYPGSDGSATMYEDDGKSFDYRQGASMRMTMTWRNAARRLTIDLAPGSRMLAPLRRPIAVRVAGTTAIKMVAFDGKAVTITL